MDLADKNERDNIWHSIRAKKSYPKIIETKVIGFEPGTKSRIKVSE